MDKGDSQLIPTVALVDRVFQQRRLLEGNSTANIATLTKIIEAKNDDDEGKGKVKTIDATGLNSQDDH